jgi:hypothetical protein
MNVHRAWWHAGRDVDGCRLTLDAYGRSGVAHAEHVVDRPHLNRHYMEINDAFGDRTRPFRSRAFDHVIGGQLFVASMNGPSVGIDPSPRHRMVVVFIDEANPAPFNISPEPTKSWWSASCLPKPVRNREAPTPEPHLA